MLRFTGLHGFNRVPQAAGMNQVLGQTLTTDSAGWAGYCVRQFIQPGALPTLPSVVRFIRLSLQAISACGLGSLYVGVGAAGAGAPGNLNALTAVPVTYQRATAINIPASTTLAMDIVEFLYVSAPDNKPLYIGWYIVGATTGHLAVLAPFTGSTYWYRSGNDQSGVLNVTASEWTQAAPTTAVLGLVSGIMMGMG